MVETSYNFEKLELKEKKTLFDKESTSSNAIFHNIATIALRFKTDQNNSMWLFKTKYFYIKKI